MPDQPLLAHWRGRRLYERRPVDLGWVQCTWMLGGLPLSALLNRRVLPSLPLPAKVRLRIARTTCVLLALLGGLAFLTPFFVTTHGDGYDIARFMVLVVAPVLAGLVLHATFGQAVTGAYRTLHEWGGESRGGFVFLLIPMFAGVALDLAVLWPLLALGEALKEHL